MNINQQPISRIDSIPSPDPHYLVHSIFRTIQGEGPFVGIPSIFIRLGGCNLQCPLCDTDYTEGNARLSLIDIAERLSTFPENLVVITGGEPFRQHLFPLVSTLIASGYSVQIETNGTLFQDDLPYGCEEFAVICSPKTGAINKHLEPHITAFKYVVKNGGVSPVDGLPIKALDHVNSGLVARPPKDFPLALVYVQPADEQHLVKNTLNLEVAIASCQQFGYRLCLQIHKIINLP